MERKSPNKKGRLGNRKSRAKKLVVSPPPLLSTSPEGMGTEPYASEMQPKAVSTSRPAPCWCYCAKLITASAVVVLAALCLGI